jgi:hypothetical protein
MPRTTISAGDLALASVGNTFAQLGYDQPRNGLANGSFEIWQRGTTGLAGGTSSTTGFMADRWQSLRGSFAAGLTGSRETGTGPCRYALRLTRATGNTSTTNISVYQTLETANVEVYAGQEVTFSAWVRAGATFAGTFAMRILSGTGTDQGVYAGFTGSATVVSTSKSLTTSWQLLSVTGTVASNVTGLAVGFLYNPSTGTAGASDYFEFTAAQLEIGNQVSPFQMNGGSVQAELVNCQRYYRRFGFGTNNNIVVMGAGSGTTTTNFFQPLYPPMRIAPSSVAWSAIQMKDGTGATTAITGLALANGSPTSTCIQATHTLNDTAHRPYCLDTTSTTGYIELNAEV